MPGLWLSTAGPAGHGLDLGAPYLASRVFGDGNLWDALETAELQDVALSLWAQGTTHFTGVLSPAQAEPQASVIATGIFWCGTYLHEDSDSWGLLPGGGSPELSPASQCIAQVSKAPQRGWWNDPQRLGGWAGERVDKGPGVQQVHTLGAPYLLGTVVSPLILGQTEPLLVPGGPCLAAPVFPLDAAPWLSNILVAREAGAPPITGLGSDVGRKCNFRLAGSTWLP